MINLLPEPKHIIDNNQYTKSFRNLTVDCPSPLRQLAKLRFWNYSDIIGEDLPEEKSTFKIIVKDSLDGFTADNLTLFKEQGYHLCIKQDNAVLYYENKSGFINGITSLKVLLQKKGKGYILPCCEITDWPSIPVRAVAPTFSWYAGYGRIGFDCQLWNYEKWIEFLNISLDNKINQFNMVLYGYWPFELDKYPETVFKNIPVNIWNRENRQWLTIHYTHPNIEKPYLDKLISYAHMFDFRIFAYVGLNSYNGAYSIKHPDARMIPPKTGGFLNDFDSLCLSKKENVDYILAAMKKIAELGFDGFTLEESEEGFWYCECEACKRKWHKNRTPVEAKHDANIWLLNLIWEQVKKVNKHIILGIRAFRQPPLEKDIDFLKHSVQSMPPEINLFWAPGLYVPESEFKKWCEVFGKQHIWGRDSEANSITSTMGRLYRTFKSNMIRYKDETNEQVIETDIRQHMGSTEMGVHAINGFVFEWYGLFLHEFAHGNYGWGSKMKPDIFFKNTCKLNFGPIGQKVLYVMKNMLTIHESQMPFYTTPFPFQKNKIKQTDIPRIMKAKENHPHIMMLLKEIIEYCKKNSDFHHWLAHFEKLENAEQRNAIIYDMVLASLRYEAETDLLKKDKILDEILYLNEVDFDLAKSYFFDVNPVEETGVKSCMFPYHEIKRLIHNIRHPDKKDEQIICSGVEALGWLWL